MNFDNQPRMIHKITLKKGVEGIYAGYIDGQFEFIINNKDKSIIIDDVSYDEKSNRFKIESTLEMKN
ncbi:hypothetical protein IJS77_00005 [bacterium]|nr:hypothetical protein [bacterium]